MREKEKKVKKEKKEKEKTLDKTQEKKGHIKKKQERNFRRRRVCPRKRGWKRGGGVVLVLSDGVANEDAVSWSSTNQEA